MATETKAERAVRVAEEHMRRWALYSLETGDDVAVAYLHEVRALAEKVKTTRRLLAAERRAARKKR